MRYAEILAAPASRRLGRAGLEAPPLRGQKKLSLLRPLERHFPLKIRSLVHMQTHLTVHHSQRKSEDPAKTTYSIFAFLSRPCRSER